MHRQDTTLHSLARHAAPSRQKALVAAILASALGAVHAGTPAQGSFVVAHATSLRGGDAVVGALAQDQPIHVEVALALRQRAALDALVADNAKRQAAGLAPRLLTPAAMLAHHAPTAQQAQAVVDFLQGAGFTNVRVAPNRLLVSADGTARSAAGAFATRLAQVRTHDGRQAYANTDDVRLPPALGGIVHAVVGLQNVHQAHVLALRQDPGAVHVNTFEGHFPADFPAIYGANANAALASDVTVGIVTQGNLNQVRTDLAVYAKNNGLPAIATQQVNTNGAGSDVTNTFQWDLDSQAIVGMAGNVGKLVFYDVPTLGNADLTADYNTIVAANQAKLIEVSVGGCENDAQADGSAAADDAIFQSAVAQGQTFAVAAGDSGADECPADHVNSAAASWPAASPYVVAVGGTTLSAASARWNAETAWIGGGGSPSTFEAMPVWQSTAGVPGTTRGVPDVAFEADPRSGALIYVNLALAQYGGTSLGAALFAGTWARVLQTRGSGFGFAAPLLYALPAGDFHDVTTGNNRLENAGTGYDFTSGRGSMLLSKSVADSAGLGNQRPVADFSYTISGLTANFTDASTDADGTIATHAWDFGDGTTSAAASPSHTYAVGGIYRPSERVYDNDGSSSIKAVTFPIGTADLLKNGGFETGTAAHWSLTDPHGVVKIVSNSNDAYEGNDAMQFFSYDTSLIQQVTIPSNFSSATLTVPVAVWYYYANNTGRYDTIDLQVYPLNGAVTTLMTLSNLDAQPNCTSFACVPAYVPHSFDLTPYVGQTIKIRFRSRGPVSGWNDTIFWLDGITITAQ